MRAYLAALLRDLAEKLEPGRTLLVRAAADADLHSSFPHRHSLDGAEAVDWRRGHFTRDRTDLPYPPAGAR